MKVVVIGGGIAGCAVAYYLAKGGAEVTLLERGRIGEEATGASAGMLAPIAEAKQPGPFLDAVVAGLRMYESAVNEIEDVSGVSTGYNRRSILRIAFTEEDEAKFHNALPMYELAKLPYSRLTAEEARKEEPALGGEVLSAILSPMEGQVVPRQLVQAYRYGAVRCGALIREGTEAHDIVTDGANGVTVHLAGETVPAEAVVIAAGAWSARFRKFMPELPRVFPVRGQIVALKGLPTFVRHVLYSYTGYAVPWPDGTLLLGSTQDEVGYDSRTSVEGITTVIRGGLRMVPAVAQAEVSAVWAGLRPGSSDVMPLMGRAPGQDTVWLATGHFRNGILLGPYTAELLARSMLSGSVAPELTAFSPNR
ncbi:MAG: glycine oxidase ThiO [Armatimonadetes bacterium]|nr:glycine oxidase ThiO [Armatimonadota bacterium]